MTVWDVDKLADEIARVATPRLGWPLRSDAKTEQLRRIAEALTDHAPTENFLLYEIVLKPSIERLRQGPMGRLAQIEFGLTEESAKLSFLKQRRDLAMKKLGIRPNAIEGRERDMHLAIARDLVVQWAASRPTRRYKSPRFAGMTDEERSRAEFIDATRRLLERASRQTEEELMAGEITEEEIEETFNRDPDELIGIELRWQKQTEESR
jgi:hypothetical protein